MQVQILLALLLCLLIELVLSTSVINNDIDTEGKKNVSKTIPGELGRKRVEKTMEMVKHMKDKKFNATLIVIKTEYKGKQNLSEAEIRSNLSLVSVPKKGGKKYQVADEMEKTSSRSTSFWESLMKIFKRFG